LLENISAAAAQAFRAAGFEVEAQGSALEEPELVEKIRGGERPGECGVQPSALELAVGGRAGAGRKHPAAGAHEVRGLFRGIVG